MHIESRERNKTSRGWTDWSEFELCVGTEGLTPSECKSLIADWSKDDAESTFWLKIEYRTVEST
jgi:hypothetical protein